MGLHEQVFRQQAELNELSQRLEERTMACQVLTLVLDASEKLLTAAPDWEGLAHTLPAAMSLLLPFDRLEYRARATSTDLGGVLLQGVAVLGESEAVSSPEAHGMAILQQVMQSGSTAVRHLQVSDPAATGGGGASKVLHSPSASPW